MPMTRILARFYSECLSRNVQAQILLPQGYGPFPTLFLLHGMGGNESIMERRIPIERMAERFGLAVVLPCGDLSWYTNTFWGERYLDYTADELVRSVRRFLPALTRNRSDTFIAGISMGGYGAIKCALTHPETFAKAASLSGGLDLTQMVKIENSDDTGHYWTDLFGPEDTIAGSGNDLFYLAETCGEPLPELYIGCGTEDFCRDMNLSFQKHLERLSWPAEFRFSPGEHNWEFWEHEMPHVLNWITSGKGV